MDTGIWRRLIVIPFEQTITPSVDIKNYADHLYAKAGGAVLAWIMEGARLIHSENYHLSPPKQVVAHRRRTGLLTTGSLTSLRTAAR